MRVEPRLFGPGRHLPQGPEGHGIRRDEGLGHLRRGEIRRQQIGADGQGFLAGRVDARVRQFPVPRMEFGARRVDPFDEGAVVEKHEGADAGQLRAAIAGLVGVDDRLAIDAALQTSTGKVVIKTNDGGSGGVLSFGANGSLQYNSTGNLQINGQYYKLEASASSLISDMNSDTNGFYALAATGTGLLGVGTNTNPVGSFAGTVEGLGNSMSSTAISFNNSTSNIGIIGYLTGTVADLHVTGVNTTDTYTVGPVGSIGGLVGQS